jgi:hypothetical protein
MGFFQRFTSIFRGSTRPTSRHLPVYVYSQRCAEAIAGQIDLMNELSAGGDGEDPWFVRKVLHTSGSGRCFDHVDVSIWLDANKQITRHEVVHGMWLEPDEYDRLVVARASTLQDDRPGGGSASIIDETEKPGGNPNSG